VISKAIGFVFRELVSSKSQSCPFPVGSLSRFFLQVPPNNFEQRLRNRSNACSSQDLIAHSQIQDTSRRSDVRQESIPYETAMGARMKLVGARTAHYLERADLTFGLCLRFDGRLKILGIRTKDAP
jgi:hypothetical protein